MQTQNEIGPSPQIAQKIIAIKKEAQSKILVFTCSNLYVNTPIRLIFISFAA